MFQVFLGIKPLVLDDMADALDFVIFTFHANMLSFQFLPRLHARSTA